jgi:hypothetical protein
MTTQIVIHLLPHEIDWFEWQSKQLKAGSIYIDLQPLAQLNITTASIDKPTKTNPIYGGGMDDSQSLAFTGYSFSRIKCHNPRCNWSWKVKDGGDDLFVCHKCFTDNSKFYLKH